MKKIVVIVSMLLMSGCINLYTRSPFTNVKIERPWQSTQTAADLSYVVMFPQTLSPASNRGFSPANLISVPIGCLCWIDVVCEAIIDTLLWPVDAANQSIDIAL